MHLMLTCGAAYAIAAKFDVRRSTFNLLIIGTVFSLNVALGRSFSSAFCFRLSFSGVVIFSIMNMTVSKQVKRVES